MLLTEIYYNLNLKKLILGTAQLSQKYGINNQNRFFSTKQSFEILKASLDSGIYKWDTSPEYDKSEIIIGKFLKKNKSEINISTKLPSINKKFGKKISKNNLKNYIELNLFNSLQNLNVSKIDTYYIHDENDIILYGDDLITILLDKVNLGIINQIGISLYDLNALEITNQFKGIKTVQLPINIFDKKYAKSLNLLVKKKIDVVGRSIFLQGLFFLTLEEAKKKLPQSYNHIKKLIKLSEKYNLSTTEIAIRYVRTLNSSINMLLGIDNTSQLKNNLIFFKMDKLKNELFDDINESFNNLPLQITDPRKWN